MQSSGVVYGIGTYIKQLTETLKHEKDVSLNIVIRHSEEPEFIIKEDDGVRTFYFPKINHPINSFNAQFDSVYNRNVCFLLFSNIRPKSSDKLIFHLNYYEEGSFIPYFKKYYPECLVLFTIHYQRWSFLLNGNTTYFRKLMHNAKSDLSDNDKLVLQSCKAEKDVLQSVDRIICLAGYTKDILMKDYAISQDKISLIYNGLKDEGEILTKKEKLRLRKELFFENDEILILFVGRLDKIKGLEKLIQAFKIILNDLPQARLVVVGDGDYNAYLKECEGSWGKITFTGRLNRELLYQFYQIADVGVMPSFHEQCSYVAIEMMMFGVPLVISTSTGLSEMIDDEFYPIKVDVLENETTATVLPEELAVKITAALSDKKQANNIRRNYLKKFLPTTMGNRYIHLTSQ